MGFPFWRFRLFLTGAADKHEGVIPLLKLVFSCKLGQITKPQERAKLSENGWEISLIRFSYPTDTKCRQGVQLNLKLESLAIKQIMSLIISLYF